MYPFPQLFRLQSKYGIRDAITCSDSYICLVFPLFSNKVKNKEELFGFGDVSSFNFITIIPQIIYSYANACDQC